MNNSPYHRATDESPLSRRDFLWQSGGGLGGVALTTMLGREPGVTGVGGGVGGVLLAARGLPREECEPVAQRDERRTDAKGDAPRAVVVELPPAGNGRVGEGVAQL